MLSKRCKHRSYPRASCWQNHDQKDFTLIYYAEYETIIIGTLLLTSDGSSLTGCWFDAETARGRFSEDLLRRNDTLEIFAATRNWLDRYFAGEAPHPSELPLKASGSAFQMKVWGLLSQIPYGRTVTYADIAKQITAPSGKRMAAQAVGGAVGRNPLGVIVPCHRVMGANGNLTGFGGGLDKKVALLEHEGIDTSRFHMPA